MKKIICIMLAMVGMAVLGACGGPDRFGSAENPDSSDNESSGELFSDIDSSEDLDEAMNAVGDAEGDDYSGEYDSVLTDITYSGDCEADFVLAHDFQIDMTLAEGEVGDILENGIDERAFTLEVVQDDGVLTVLDLGDDDGDLTGTVYKDGSFRIAYGTFEDEDNYIWSDYQGVFSDDGVVEGTFKTKLYVTDYTPSGSCTVTADFSGERSGS